jgi:hypothetical protein
MEGKYKGKWIYVLAKSCKRIAHHEWFIEFENEPEDDATFLRKLDKGCEKANMYYDDLIIGNILWSVKWLKRSSRVYEVDRKIGRTK